MLKTITVTAHNRPDLLKLVLEDLARNNLEGWKVFFSIEPTEVRDEIISVISQVLDGVVEYELILPETKLGVKTNPYKLMSYVYDEIGSDVNIYLEDDIRISPDVTKIADWYMTLPRKSYHEFGGVCLCKFWATNKDYSDIQSREFVIDPYNFSALGFIVDRRGWYDQFKSNWYRTNHHLQRTGWDFAIRAHVIWHGIKWLYPVVTRSTHTGTRGTHCNAKIQAQYKFDDMAVFDGDTTGEYFVSNFSLEEKDNICFVVPYRDREDQIETFVSEINSHMRTYHPDIKHEIHLIEQLNDKPFNRAKLLNIGYDLNKHKSCYFCFHDIDLIPEGECCDYSFPHTPVHLSAFCSQFEYKVPYENIFGGVTIFDKFHFEKVNGYSNEYWGWGAEDDDMRKRLQRSLVLTLPWERAGRGIKWHRRPGRFRSLPHAAGPRKASKQNKHRLGSGYIFEEDGLSSLDYTLIESVEKESYTVHKVDL